MDAFELWCCRRLLRVPWTAKISNPSLLKEINPEYSLEGLMLKLQYFCHQASLSFTISQSLFKLMSIKSVMPSDHLVLCHLLLLLPSIFPSIRVFSSDRLFASGDQSIGASASTSVLLMNVQDWFPLEGTGWISLQSKGLSRVFSSTTVQKYQFFCAQCSLLFNSYIHTWLLKKPYLWL